MYILKCELELNDNLYLVGTVYKNRVKTKYRSRRKVVGKSSSSLEKSVVRVAKTMAKDFDNKGIRISLVDVAGLVTIDRD